MSFDRVRLPLAVIVILLITGCQSVGPAMIPKDRDSYVDALSESQTEQLLLNIVKLRHGEAPTFVDVTQIVAGYELERDVTLSGTFRPSIHDDGIDAGASGHFSDRPTITYAPLTGERYARSVVFPVPVHLILSLFESGWTADDILHLFVKSLNGVRNRQPRRNAFVPADPAFGPLAELVRGLQEAGALEFRQKHAAASTQGAAGGANSSTGSSSGTGGDSAAGGAEEPAIVAILDDRDGHATDLVNDARTRLGVSPSVDEIPVHTGAQRAPRGQINLATYSMLQILTALGNGLEMDDTQGHETGLLHLLTTMERPKDAFASIHYRDRWYSIEDHDHRSKQTLLALVVVYRLLEWDGAGQQPILTIPTG